MSSLRVRGVVMHDIIRQRLSKPSLALICPCVLPQSAPRPFRGAGSLEPVTPSPIAAHGHVQRCLARAATPDFSVASIRAAILRAKRWAEHRCRVHHRHPSAQSGHPVGEYSSPVERPWDSVPLSENSIPRGDRQLPIDKRIVEWTSDWLASRYRACI